MSIRNNGNAYGSMSKLFHWGITLLIVATIAFVELHELFPKGSSTRSGLMILHIQIGLMLFGLTALRLAWRSANPGPAIVPEPKPWEGMLAKLMHVALYGAIVALPILGFAMLQSAGKPVALLGMPLPILLAENKDLADVLKEAHEVIGNLLMVLVGFHVAAAIWHHLIKQDNTLLRMLPEALSRLRNRAA
ncbi:MAG: cytochrome b [Sulfuritalea sp.]|nr:cytochrome b [Sulfuritalea sp.]